jgi:hypothetical protein
MTFEERIRSHQKPTDEHRWPNMTIRHLGHSIMEIHKEEDAKEFLAGYLPWLEAQADLDTSALHVAQSNIGWFFGEGMSETDKAMWRNLIGASHPIFGAMKTNPTPQEAFDAGVARGIK